MDASGLLFLKEREMKYAKHFSTKSTPQSQPIPGKAQIKNDAGGYVFEASAWNQLQRFLVLGAEGGTYYAGERKLTQEAATNTVKCIKENGVRVVSEIVNISREGRAAKNDAAIFALALACTHGDELTKSVAYANIKSVCRTGTHIFQFCDAIQAMRGWSRGLRTGVSRFYTENSNLSLQLIKYRQREGWTHRDVLRLAHPKPQNDEQRSLFAYAVGKPADELTDLASAFEAAKLATSAKDIVRFIEQYGLPREAIDTKWLNYKTVWHALLPHMPAHALVRNLGKLTSVEVLTSNLSTEAATIAAQLRDAAWIKRSRLHPLALLNAARVYAQGHGDKGSLNWTPVTKIVDALNDAFYMAFANVTPTKANMLVALDLSGSMHSNINGMNLTASSAGAAMALVIAATEPNVEVIGFTDKYENGFSISGRQRLDDVIKHAERFGGGTDCSIPMAVATQRRLALDAIVLLSDAQTWSGYNHPSQAMNAYRRLYNPNCKFVGVGMATNQFDITDPADQNGLSVAGFDTQVPAIINQFIAGTL
jgi:60 kDa SS-A/Ro ribonucleoprotein